MHILLSLLLFVASFFIPQSWILRPFLTILGFGPMGPIKGFAAAWMQSHLWGAAVQAGSWFSLLQKAGMGIYPVWAGLAAKVPMWAGGLLALLF